MNNPNNPDNAPQAKQGNNPNQRDKNKERPDDKKGHFSQKPNEKKNLANKNEKKSDNR
jgi:hypothetical protein